MIFFNRQPNLTSVCVDLDLQPTLWKMKSLRYLAWLSSICLLIAFVTSSAGAATNKQSESINWTFPYEEFPDQTFTLPVTLPEGTVLTLPMKMTGKGKLKIINRATGRKVFRTTFTTTFTKLGRIAGRARVKLLAGDYEVEELLTISASINMLMFSDTDDGNSFTWPKMDIPVKWQFTADEDAIYHISVDHQVKKISVNFDGEKFSGSGSASTLRSIIIVKVNVTEKLEKGETVTFSTTLSATINAKTTISPRNHIFDLVTDEFGETPPDNLAADVDGNGTVDIFDLVLANNGPAAAPVASIGTSTHSNVEIQMVAKETVDNLVTLQIQANSAVKLGGVQFDLYFDTERLSFVESTKGDLFEAQGVQSYWLPPKMTDGKLTFALAAIDAPPSSISKELAKVLAQATFRVKSLDSNVSGDDFSEAMKSIRLENVQVADLDGRSIRSNWRNQINVSPLENFQNVLLQNYPNPFNPETWMPYSIVKDANVTIRIYDSLGRTVRTIDVGFIPAGEYISKERAAYWDGRNKHGEHVASGVYFYTMEADSFVATKKLLILK